MPILSANSACGYFNIFTVFDAVGIPNNAGIFEIWPDKSDLEVESLDGRWFSLVVKLGKQQPN